MIRNCASMARPVALGVLVILIARAPVSIAGEHRFFHGRRAAVRPVPTTFRNDPVYGDRLGTFMPTPAVVVQGNYPAGGGYAPLGTFGETSMSLYGPISSFRSTTAPVVTYTRGYDGVVRPGEAVTTSYPMLPILAPVAYPTRANYYYGPRIIEDPARDSAINWMDLN
jgi:hypothetical protein